MHWKTRYANSRSEYTAEGWTLRIHRARGMRRGSPSLMKWHVTSPDGKTILRGSTFSVLDAKDEAAIAIVEHRAGRV